MTKRVFEPYKPRETSLGALPIWRALPVRQRRTIGPWCFLDRYGPLSFTDEKPMDVAPHPHIGIQTVSWLLEGEVVHHDTLGCEGVVRPGGVNVMTSGRGIAHSEETPKQNSGRLNGVQMWVALPDSSRNIAPSFQAIEEVPRVEFPGAVVSLFIGTFAKVKSPADAYSDIVGVEIEIHRNGKSILPLVESREHCIFPLSGDAEVDMIPLEVNTLYDLGRGRGDLWLSSRGGARVLLLGGVPFREEILMWWNFVARAPEEIAAARAKWEAGEFGVVAGYAGPPLAAPPLNRLAPPNPAS